MPGSNTSCSSSAHSEQIKQPSINLASLPRDEAIERARVAGREILGDGDSVQFVADTLCMNWINANAPIAVGQTDDQFGELIDAMCNEFFVGLTEGVRRFSEDARILSRTECLLAESARATWRIFNVIAFMAEALPEDKADQLPTRGTLVELRDDISKLAAGLMDLIWSARHG